MSRIHEALKKAEQERAATQGGSLQPSFATTPVADSPVFAETPAATVAPLAPAHPGMPAFASPFSTDTLLARCAQLEWNPDPTTMLFLNGDDNARGTEEYRTLRSRLYHLREKMPLKKLLITSALPKEGKSFTSSNLAQVMVRQHGRRALLIDADLRAPRLHTMLGTTSDPGLSDYLLGKNDEFSIMQRGPLENLFFIPSGTGAADPAELVGNGRLKLLLQRVEPLFDWIIIDSPPAVPVSDASVLAKVCDGVLMVVRSNATPFDLARKARQEFPDQALVGVVLNGTTRGCVALRALLLRVIPEEGNHDQGLGGVRVDPAFQCLLPRTNAGASSRGGPSRGAFLSLDVVVAKPGDELDSAQRPRRVCEDRLCHGDRVAAFARFRPVRFLQHGRQVGSDLSPLHGVGPGGIFSGCSRPRLSTISCRVASFFPGLSGVCWF